MYILKIVTTLLPAHTEAPQKKNSRTFKSLLYIYAEKHIKPTQFWHIFIIKVSRNCDLASWNELFLTN